MEYSSKFKTYTISNLVIGPVVNLAVNLADLGGEGATISWEEPYDATQLDGYDK